MNDPTFRAEVSLLKTADAKREAGYGTANSIRIDIYELTRHNIVCVYDVKTGRSGLSFPRAAEMARTAFHLWKDVPKLVVSEVRPHR